MDQVTSPPAPRWFTLAAVAALLFEIAGCVIYLNQVLNDHSALADERALTLATPFWVTAAFAIAVWSGLAGSVLLNLRRRQAPPFLLLSLVAVVVQVSAYLLVPALRNLTQSDDLFLPFVIIVVSYSVWHFARRARASGWLR